MAASNNRNVRPVTGLFNIMLEFMEPFLS